MEQDQSGSLLGAMLPLLVLFLIFYFLVIRPQQKQNKQHKAMIEGLKKGDKVITNGGLIAEVIKPEQNFVKLKIADNVFVKLKREYVAKMLEDDEPTKPQEDSDESKQDNKKSKKEDKKKDSKSE